MTPKGEFILTLRVRENQSADEILSAHFVVHYADRLNCLLEEFSYKAKRGQRQIGRLVSTHHIAVGVFHANKPLAPITPASRVRRRGEAIHHASRAISFHCASYPIHFGREAFLIWCAL
jgi:hypothetical protein